ncbi:MAG: 6-bladed beta-propeller [Tannerellaceae bacterium]|nr:6-bladed beta-propeller [Tannerellaceae bacterium]
MKKLSAIASTILIALTPAVFEGCKQSAVTDGLVTVDVTANYPERELILQDFMDVEYIPLETTDEFLTQGDVVAINDNFIVARNFVNSGDIFFFDRKTGKGVKKINRKGQGGEEYTSALSVALDDERGELFVNDHYIRKIFVYDLEGNFKRSFKHKEGVMYNYMYSLDRDNLICFDGMFTDDATASGQPFMLVSKQDGSVKEIYVPFEKRIVTVLTSKNATNGMVYVAGPSGRPLIPCFDDWLIIEASADTIYTYSRDNIMTPFIARTPPIHSMDPEVFLFVNLITDRYYFMETAKREFNFETSDGFPGIDLVYDKEEKAIYKPTVYNDDYTNRTQVSMTLKPVGGEVPSWQQLQAHRLVEDFKEGKLKGRLAEIAAGLDEESNPVIMLVKHKK